jgi:prepilin-type N-terminal cleavage/methylation domain-containing protein
MRGSFRNQHGFSLLELMIAMLLAGLILAATGNVIRQAMGSNVLVTERNQLLRDARFAMQRMVSKTSTSRKLLLPLVDKSFTNWPENIREETVPASPPIGSSTKATAVLAIALPSNVDLDADGFPDADDDRDGLIDEDLPDDAQHDFAAGIMLIDDDGDGLVDEGNASSDDESTTVNDDPINGIDDDADGNIDEDPGSDNNGDGCPGVCGVDDDADGTIDDGSASDDDEDGSDVDDAYNPVVYYLNGNTLMERMPVPWNQDGISTPDGPVDGRDFVASAIADNVTRFRIERIGPASDAHPMVDIELELTGPTGEVVSVAARVRTGGAL